MKSEALDLRGLEPPEPLVRILATLESGSEGPFEFLLSREPYPLYALVAPMGWRCAVSRGASGVVVTVTRR